MGETVLYIGIFILAGIYFFIFHKLFDVFYFGYKGILSTFLGCCFAAIFTIGLVLRYWYWILIIGGVGFFLIKMGSKSEAE